MIDKINKEICTGCNACFSVCPQKCIEMDNDYTGFNYPKVDYKKCIRCEMCLNTCPSLNKVLIEENWREPKIYAAWSLDEEIRRNSTSGGIFSELAKEIINNNGLVVAARYNNDNMVEHHMIKNINEIKKLRQSKYVQSDIGDILEKVKIRLNEGLVVAFCGSPCQVAGLLKFLKKPYQNLITFDFVCRGTNSPKAYAKYIEMLERKYNSKIEKMWFKNKTYGWNRFSTKVDFKNGESYIKDRYNDYYMRGYIEENLYMRDCCFNCKYKLFPRNSDITLADFWGIGIKNPELDEDKGTSLIMINSIKGSNLFMSITNKIYFKESDLEVALSGNLCIVESVKKNPNSDNFLKMLDNYSFDLCFKKYAQNKFYRKIKNIVYKMVSKIKRILNTF